MYLLCILPLIQLSKPHYTLAVRVFTFLSLDGISSERLKLYCTAQLMPRTAVHAPHDEGAGRSRGWGCDDEGLVNEGVGGERGLPSSWLRLRTAL